MANDEKLQSEILNTLKAIKNELERGRNRTTNNVERNFDDGGMDFETEKKARSEWNKRQYKKYSWEEQQKEKYWSLVKQGKQGQANKVASKVGKANLYQAIGGEVQKTANQITQTWLKLAKLEYEVKKVNLETSKKVTEMQLKLTGESLKKSIAVGTGGLMSTIQENSERAAQNALDLGKEYLMTNLDITQALYSKTIQREIKEIEGIKTIVGDIATSASSALSSIPNPYTAIAGAVIGIGNSIFQAYEEKEIMQLQYKEDILKSEQELEKEVIGNIAETVKQFQDLASATDKLLMTIDTQANNTARMFGFSGRETENYVRAAAVLNKEMAVMGKTFEDLNKMQSAYISESGRNVLMNGKEGQMMSAFGKLYNISDEESAQIMGAMNIFNTSIESGSDIMFEMYKTANRMGVSNQKFAKDMQKNLKIAEKYQFKGGVKGMMDMALWAQKTRFNMDSLSGVLEKMHTGDIADVIQTSAKLNVLGGNAALLSDPMAMLYNAYADPAQYAKNMQQMIQGFGHFNSKTGETEFNINEQMRMEAMASALGVSKEDFFNMARQEKKLGNIKKVLGGRFSSDETDFITQNATFNKDTGQWEVNVMGANGELQRRDINTLTQEELDSIFPEDNQQQLVEYTKGIFSILEKNTATEYKYKSDLAYRTQDAHREKYKETRDIQEQHYNEYIDEYAHEVNELYKFAPQALQEQLRQAGKYLENPEIGEKYRTMSLAALVAQTENIDKYVASMDAIMSQDLELKKAFVNMWDDALGAKMDIIFDEIRAQSEYQQIRANGEITKEEMIKIFQDEFMTKQFMQDYETKYLTEDEMKILAYQGDLTVKDNYVKDKEGKLYVLSSDATMYDRQNKEIERTGNYTAGFWDSFINRFENVAQVGTWFISNGFRFDKNNVPKLVHDLIISPKHGIYETDPEDTIVASKPGGSLDRASQSRGGLSDNVTLNITGSLALSNGSQKIDLMELLRNDPNALRELTKEIIKEGSNTVFGGKHEWAPNRYTFS